MFNLLSTRTPRTFSAKWLSIQLASSLHLLHGVNSSQMQDFSFAFFELLEGLLRTFTNLLRSIQLAALPTTVLVAPLNLIQTENHLKVYSITVFSSIMKVLNISGPNIDPCRTPVVTITSWTLF